MTTLGTETSTAAHRVLDRSSAMPLYHQLFIDLRRRLLEGEWRPGEAFLKDSEIEESYGVSRITVRQAMSQLVDANFVVRYRGRGSFVGNLPSDEAASNHISVRDEVVEAGGTHECEILRFEVHEVSEVTARQLDIAAGDRVGILHRLHRSDGMPYCLEMVMLSIDRFPTVFGPVRDGTETLSQAYDRLGIVLMKCDQTVNAVLPSEASRTLLDIEEGAPALFVERVGYSADNKPLEVRRLRYRADMHTLRQEVIFGPASNRIV